MVPDVPAVLVDARGQRYARLVVLSVNDQECEAIAVLCRDLPPGSCDQPGHHHWALLAPVAIGGRN